MKTSKFFVGILLFITSFSFIHCTPDQDYSETTKDILSQGTWTVDYYFAGQDLTAQYSSYEFSFTANGTVTGTDANGAFEGNWSLIKDVNRNDVLQININTQQAHLAELNEQWNITDKTTSVLAMKDVNSTQLRLRKL